MMSDLMVVHAQVYISLNENVAKVMKSTLLSRWDYLKSRVKTAFMLKSELTVVSPLSPSLLCQ